MSTLSPRGGVRCGYLDFLRDGGVSGCAGCQNRPHGLSPFGCRQLSPFGVAFSVLTFLLLSASQLLLALHRDGASGAGTVWAISTAATGVWMLFREKHFARPLCTLLSLNYWCSIVWITVALSTAVGATLVVAAAATRNSVLLFMNPEGASSLKSSWLSHAFGRRVSNTHSVAQEKVLQTGTIRCRNPRNKVSLPTKYEVLIQCSGPAL